MDISILFCLVLLGTVLSLLCISFSSVRFMHDFFIDLICCLWRNKKERMNEWMNEWLPVSAGDYARIQTSGSTVPNQTRSQDCKTPSQSPQIFLLISRHCYVIKTLRHKIQIEEVVNTPVHTWDLIRITCPSGSVFAFNGSLFGNLRLRQIAVATRQKPISETAGTLARIRIEKWHCEIGHINTFRWLLICNKLMLRNTAVSEMVKDSVESGTNTGWPKMLLAHFLYAL